MLIRVSGRHDGVKQYLESGQKRGLEVGRDELDERVVSAGDLDLTDSIIQSIDADPGVDRYLSVIRRGRAPLLALVATPGYSRASFVRFTAGEDAATLCECLREAFVYFGGTPEQVLFDNAKSVIVERDAFGEGEHRWNTQLLAVAETGENVPEIVACYKKDSPSDYENAVREIDSFRNEHPHDLAIAFKQTYLRAFSPEPWGYTIVSFLDEVQRLLRE